ncbi:MAG: hypothetical protein R3E66_10150 [bacterium]
MRRITDCYRTTQPALEPMLDVIERFISDRRLAEAQAWVETCRAAVSEAEVEQDDPRVTRLWCHRTELAYGAGRLGEALDGANEVFKRRPTASLRAQAARLTALAYLRRAQTTDAMTWARRAVDEARDVDSPLARGHAHRALGWITLRAGDLEESVREMLRAADIYAEADLFEYQGLAASGASEGLRLLGRSDEAHHWLDRALSLVSPEVHRGPWGEVMIVAGVLAEEEDRIQDARMMLIQSIEALRVSGNATQHIASTCLGLAELRFGDDSRAVSMFRETIEMTERRAPIFAYVGRMGMLYAAAIAGDTQSWDRFYLELSAQSTRFRLLDLARYAGYASTAWQRLGDERRQRESLELASMLCGAWPHPTKERFASQLEQQCVS